MQRINSLFRCVLVSLHEGLSVRPSVRWSVRYPFFFLNERKRVFSTIETSRNFGWRRAVIGRDEGGKEGCDEGGGDEGGAITPRDASDGRVSGLVFHQEGRVWKR